MYVVFATDNDEDVLLKLVVLGSVSICILAVLLVLLAVFIWHYFFSSGMPPTHYEKKKKSIIFKSGLIKTQKLQLTNSESIASTKKGDIERSDHGKYFLVIILIGL